MLTQQFQSSSRLIAVIGIIILFAIFSSPTQTVAQSISNPNLAQLLQIQAETVTTTVGTDDEVRLDDISLQISHQSNDAVEITVTTIEGELANQLSPVGFAFAIDDITPRTDTIEIVIPYGEFVSSDNPIQSRLALYEVTGCESETVVVDRYPDNPNRPATEKTQINCESWQPLTAQNDLAEQELSAEIAPKIASRSAESALPSPLYVLAPTSSDGQGDYSFTPLNTVSEYEVSLNSGAMVTSYPIPVPPARAGAAPNVLLTYNSGIVDGMHQHKNNQPGIIGIGWSLQSGYITRHLKTCENIPQAPEDLCLIGDEYSITLNGVSSRLVKESGNLYRLQDDPYWKVEQFSNGHADNPDTDKEYWMVTTPDGTQYRFGGEIVPETGADQDSVFYVPVYDLSVCDINAPVFALCNKAWQWNLDRIEDTNGNVTNFFYNVETNYYNGRSDSSSAFRREYVRAGHVERIEYSTQVGQVETPNAQVRFLSEIRCSDPTTVTDCEWSADFPDTPNDLGCEQDGACSQNHPTFWTQRRISAIQTQVYDNTTSQWHTAATYDLTQSFPTPANDGNGDSSESKLWLDEIAQHAGGDYTHWAFTQIEGEDYDDSQGANIKIEDTIDVGRGENSGGEAGEYLVFENVNFDTGATSVLVRVASALNGRRIEFRLDSPTGTQIAAIDFDNTGDWQQWETMQANVTGASGIRDLYVKIEGGGFNINWFRFDMTNNLTTLPAVEYDYEMKANRRNFTLAGVSPMFMPRIDHITTELGGTVDFTYGQSHPCPTSSASYIRYPYDCFIAWDAGTPNDNGADDGFVLWNKWKVLSQSSQDSFSGNSTQTASFTYSTPTWHYSSEPTLPDLPDCDPQNTGQCTRATRHWNDWRGSDVVTVTDATGAKTEHRFHRGMDGDRAGVFGGTHNESITLSDSTTRTDSNWLRGHTVEQRRLSSGDTPLTRMVNQFYAINTIDGDTDIEDAYYVAVDQTDNTLFIGTDKTTRTAMTYDSYGNVTRQIWHGDLATTSDDRNLETVYLYNTTDYIVNRPYYERLWEGTTSSTLQNVQAYTVYQYDNLGFNTPPTTGNVTLVREHWSTNPTDMFYETTFDYDSRGRQTHVTDARNNTTQTQYHSFYGYAESVTNALNHTMQTTVDPAYGHVIETTDPNNATTTIEYDDFGRLTSVWLPDQNPSSDPASTIFNYFADARPAYIQTRNLTDQASSTYLESWEYVDGFGRTVQQQATSPTVGTRAVTSQQYDNMGRMSHESVTFAAGGVAGGNYILMDWPTRAGYHLTQYDDLSRPTARHWRNGNTTIWSDTTSYDGWHTTFTDGNGNTMEQLTDAFGQLVEVVEHPDPVTDYTTTYQYNIRGDLVQVTDDDSNITTMNYDLLSRKTSMDDPDMGQWYYDYDAVGNLISQVDARAKGICSYYDELNRITGKVYDEGAIPNPPNYTCQSNPSSFDIEYRYDESGYGSSVGRLTRVFDEAGTHSQSYNSRGLVTSETRTILAQFSPESYTQSYTYDALDRLKTTTYPDGEVVTTSYDEQGLPNSLTGDANYVSSATYNVRGQMVGLNRANGVNTTLQYYDVTERFRLQRTNDSALDQWVDEYDNVGNVKQLRTRYANDAEPAVTFNYDGLNRLLSATGSPYNRSYGYDALGNITNLNGQAYQYNSSRPHAVTNVGGDTYSYDASGNMTSRTEDGDNYTQEFDVENRLVTVNKPDGSRLEFLYDHTGQRMRTTEYSTGGNLTKFTFYPFATYEQEAIPAVPTAIQTTGTTLNQLPNLLLIGTFLLTIILLIVTRKKLLWRWLVIVGLLTQFVPTAQAQTIVQVSRRNYLFNGQVVAVRTFSGSGNELVYLHNDHLGSATVLTDSSGNVIADSVAKYYPFGDYRQEPTDDVTEIGFTGHRHNDDVGLIYANARFYLPHIGRFASPDTIVPDPSNPQTINRYSYTENRPLTMTDPTGHFGFIGAAIGGVVGGVVTGGIYALRTHLDPSQDFKWSEFGTAVGVGAVGGALVGSGIGVTAGAAVLSGGLATTATTAIGAGTGVLVSANVYTATTQNFDQSDFVVTSVAGGIDGAIAARFPASGFTPALSRSVSSGIVGASESIASDIFNQQSVNWRSAGVNGLVGFGSAGTAEFITGGFDPPYPYTLRQPPEIRPTQWLDRQINSRDIWREIVNQGQANARTIARDIGYGVAVNKGTGLFTTYQSPSLYGIHIR